MTTEIYVISGFLGAGKTTLIQKLLKEAFQKDKVVLIENDFGEISIDAALLKSGGVEVKEMNSGCICCSLSGDFVKALKELIARFHPEKIIIEPSGVGKLSDIIKACSDPRILSLASVKTKITVVDAKRCQMYLDNFGEFFEDQIQNADVVLISRTEDSLEKIKDVCKLVKSLNAHSVILSKPWSQITAAEILNSEQEQPEHGVPARSAPGCECHSHDGHHEHSAHDDVCECEHHHSAEDVFDTVTIRTKKSFDIADLKARISTMERSAHGTILRAKGILCGTNGYLNLQYLPGDLRITTCDTSGNMLCIIGRNLNHQELINLFNGE